jgi:putative addiction module component (TIGR02574 family)
MSTPQEILAAIESLAPDEQRYVAQQIRDAYPLADEWIPDEAELALLDQRMEDIDSGKVEPLPASEVRRILRDRLNRYE